jgi:hypothetical protein
VASNIVFGHVKPKAYAGDDYVTDGWETPDTDGDVRYCFDENGVFDASCLHPSEDEESEEEVDEDEYLNRHLN